MAELIQDVWRVFGERIWDEPELAADLYRALSNNTWAHQDGTRFAASLRATGDIVAGLRMCGEDYLDWYGYGGEGRITPEIGQALAGRGWCPVDPPAWFPEPIDVLGHDPDKRATTGPQVPPPSPRLGVPEPGSKPRVRRIWPSTASRAHTLATPALTFDLHSRVGDL